MIPIFRKYIKESISLYINKLYPGFLEIKIGGNVGQNSIVWGFKSEKNINLYFQIYFIKDRDYVIPNIQWSKLNRFPSEDCIDEDDLDKVENNLSLLNDRDEVWLGACEFGETQNYIGLTNEQPSEDRLKEIYTSISKKILDEAEITDWRSDLTYHDWDMIHSLDSNIINEQDAEYATSGMVEELKVLISEKYFPYLKSVLQK